MKIREQKRKLSLEKKKQQKVLKKDFETNYFVYELVLMYDGSRYGGYSKQKHRNTIQNNLEDALDKVLGFHVKTIEASRTDAKVHAKDQHVMFKIPSQLQMNSFKNELQQYLPADILISKIALKNSDFHVRYDVINKTYKYYMHFEKNIFIRNYSVQIPKVNVKLMNKAAKHLLGTHDFQSFCSAKATSTTTIRTVNEASFAFEEEQLVFSINADGFLYNMIRIIVATLLEVGTNKITIAEFLQILHSKDRSRAAQTAQPQGLFLEKIYYKEDL